MNLTKDEIEVLRLVCSGMTSKKIAREMDKTVAYVNTRRKSIKHKLIGAKRSTGEFLGATAQRLGLLD
jgi:DNA-binding CsgD family transcriptional regulator